ncbi:MAG: tetratricopeptide repeat protein [Bacteroidales bacterium]|jgi:tetratricopeptide (TPR) repeat protein|nr:tetratricopeptide repeat protein [Bacteroidales bacterium]
MSYNFFGNEDLKPIIEKFESYLNNNQTQSVFFDCEELIELIDYYYDKGDINKTGKALSIALKLYPEDMDIAILNAKYISYKNNKKYAIKYLNEYLKRHPENNNEYEMILTMANLYSFDNSSKAVELYNILLKENPQDEEVLDNLANEYMLMGDFDNVDIILRKELEIEYDDLDLLEDLAINSKNLKDYQNTRKFLEELCDNHPYSINNWIGYAFLLFHNQEYYDSITALDFALAIDENSLIANCYKGLSLVALQKEKEAIEIFKSLIEKSPDEASYSLFLGDIYESLEEWDEAIEYFLQYIKKGEEDINVLISLAHAYQEKDDEINSLIYITEALEIDPKNFDARMAYAKMFAHFHYTQISDSIFEELYNEQEHIDNVAASWALNMVKSGRNFEAMHLLEKTIENFEMTSPILYYVFIEIASNENYLKDNLDNWLYKLFLNFDITYQEFVLACPNIVNNPIYENLLNTYFDEKK